MMNGIECPAIDANFFQDDPVNSLINEIWRAGETPRRSRDHPSHRNIFFIFRQNHPTYRQIMKSNSLSQLAGGSSSPLSAKWTDSSGGELDVKNMAAEPHLISVSGR